MRCAVLGRVGQYRPFRSRLIGTPKNNTQEGRMKLVREDRDVPAPRRSSLSWSFDAI